MRIETVFGIIAVVALIVLGGYALKSGKGDARAPAAQAGPVVLASAGGLDSCTCYEQAFKAGRRDPDPTSAAYEAGYGACRESAGQMGGEAWSWGYRNGIEGKASNRSCSAFKRLQG